MMMVDEIQKDAMMRYLFEALERGRDIGHYGRLRVRDGRPTFRLA
jgi:hypothetical protein